MFLHWCLLIFVNKHQASNTIAGKIGFALPFQVKRVLEIVIC